MDRAINKGGNESESESFKIFKKKMKINLNNAILSESSTQEIIIIDSSSENEEDQKFQTKNRKRQRQMSSSKKMNSGKRLSKRQKIAAVSEIFK
jgi:hypothetical protein